MNTNEAVRRLTEIVRRQRLALATERTYCAWLRRYCDLPKGLPLHLPSEHKLEQSLTVLAQKDDAASTQKQAFNAIISISKFPPSSECPASRPGETHRQFGWARAEVSSAVCRAWRAFCNCAALRFPAEAVPWAKSRRAWSAGPNSLSMMQHHLI